MKRIWILEFMHSEVILDWICTILVHSRVSFKYDVYEKLNKFTYRRCALLQYPGAVSHIIVSNMNSLCVTYTVACSGNWLLGLLVKYGKLNCHSDTESHNRLVHLMKSSNTQFYHLTNLSVEPRLIPKFSRLAFAISYFRDVIYIPSCCLAVRSVLIATQSVPNRLYCLQVLNCSWWKGENSGVCSGSDFGHQEVPCRVLRGFIL